MGWYLYTERGVRLKAEIESSRTSGALMYYPLLSPPTGWLPCNGGLLDSTVPENDELFAAIGTTYNTGGEPVNNFRVPTISARFLVGAGPSYSIGSGVSGTTSHTHTVTMGAHGVAAGHTHTIPPHGHEVTNHLHSATHRHGAGALVFSGGVSATVNAADTGLNDAFPAEGVHSHNIDVNTNYYSFFTDTTPNPNNQLSGSGGTSGVQNEIINLTSTAGIGTGSGSQLPPYLPFYVIIKK